jgi:hypothetical protein
MCFSDIFDNVVDPFSIYPLAIGIYSLEKCLLESFANFNNIIWVFGIKL